MRAGSGLRKGLGLGLGLGMGLALGWGRDGVSTGLGLVLGCKKRAFCFFLLIYCHFSTSISGKKRVCQTIGIQNDLSDLTKRYFKSQLQITFFS